MSGAVRVIESSTGSVRIHNEIDGRLMERLLKDLEGQVWVDLCGIDPEASETVLLDLFDFHPLAIEDALQEQHIPKIDDWDRYIYLVLQDANLSDPDDSIEVDVFLGPNFMVTHTKRTSPAIERLVAAAETDPRLFQFGTVRLLSSLANEIADNYLRLLDTVNEAVEDLEERLFHDPHPDLLEEAFILKRDLLHLRRFLGPQRDVLIKLSRGEYGVIEKSERIYFRDVSDHFVRLEGLNESLIELTVAARDTYLSVVNNRLNDVVKILTIITSLFMPLSFLTGFFGMNFFQPLDLFTGWTGYLAFGLVLLLTFTLPVGMFAWMKRKRWL
ncbi:MAG TPA: magnesium transporter CorA family protein [Anaerolineales bacterium]|nr:magnesium transporter CorA family protein [Anaerolineales bacterium]